MYTNTEKLYDHESPMSDIMHKNEGLQTRAELVDTLLEQYGDKLMEVYRDPDRDVLEFLHQLLLDLNKQ